MLLSKFFLNMGNAQTSSLDNYGRVVISRKQKPQSPPQGRVVKKLGLGRRGRSATDLTSSATVAMRASEICSLPGFGLESTTDGTMLRQSLRPRSRSESINVFAHPPEPAVPIEPRKLSYKLERNEYEEFGYLEFRFNSIEDAKAAALISKKPLFCVETDLPGDVDCGKEVFSHPLIVEAASSAFISVNPKDGNLFPGCRRSIDGKPCRTRVGFLDSNGNQLIPTVTVRQLTRAGLITAMIEVLKSENYVVPKYLSLIQEEESGKEEFNANGKVRLRQTRAIFGMDDSAIGEAEFGGLEGVLSTRAGSVDRQRVVEVIYDSYRLPYSTLVRFALKRKLADIICYRTNDEKIAAQIEVERMQESCELLEQFSSFKLDHDPKRALRRTPLRFVPLTDLQAARANNLVHLGRFNEAVHLLSPQQGLILMEAMSVAAQKAFHEVVDVPILLAWTSVCERKHPKRIHTTQSSDAEEIEYDDEYDCANVSSWNDSM